MYAYTYSCIHVNFIWDLCCTSYLIVIKGGNILYTFFYIQQKCLLITYIQFFSTNNNLLQLHYQHTINQIIAEVN